MKLFGVMALILIFVGSLAGGIVSIMLPSVSSSVVSAALLGLLLSSVICFPHMMLTNELPYFVVFLRGGIRFIENCRDFVVFGIFRNICCSFHSIPGTFLSSRCFHIEKIFIEINSNHTKFFSIWISGGIKH